MTRPAAVPRPTPLMRALRALPLLAAFGLAACGSLSERERNTAVGATLGGVAGSVLSGGGTLATVGGAVVGGVIGNNVDTRNDRKDRKRDR